MNFKCSDRTDCIFNMKYNITLQIHFYLIIVLQVCLSNPISNGIKRAIYYIIMSSVRQYKHTSNNSSICYIICIDYSYIYYSDKVIHHALYMFIQRVLYNLLITLFNTLKLFKILFFM